MVFSKPLRRVRNYATPAKLIVNQPLPHRVKPKTNNKSTLHRLLEIEFPEKETPRKLCNKKAKKNSSL